jgi:hypothetical protein
LTLTCKAHDAFAAEDKLAKIEELARRVGNLQSARDNAEVRDLRAEVEQLQAELKKAQGK